MTKDLLDQSTHISKISNTTHSMFIKNKYTHTYKHAYMHTHISYTRLFILVYMCAVQRLPLSILPWASFENTLQYIWNVIHVHAYKYSTINDTAHEKWQNIAYENVRVTNTVHIVHMLLYNNIHSHICMECSPDLAARMDLWQGNLSFSFETNTMSWYSRLGAQRIIL